MIYPTVNGMAAEGNVYTGFWYAGLMIMPNGQPKVIEFNCRFGDPETQPIMLRLESDLVELCLKACDGKLDEVKSQWKPKASLGIVLAAEGYPGIIAKAMKSAAYLKVRSKMRKFFGRRRSESGQVSHQRWPRVCATALGESVFEAQQKH